MHSSEGVSSVVIIVVDDVIVVDDYNDNVSEEIKMLRYLYFLFGKESVKVNRRTIASSLITLCTHANNY